MQRFFKPFKEKDLLTLGSIEEIRSMHPMQFEYFCKYFLPNFGYQSLFVTRKHGTYEADGGVDIEGTFGGQKALIQCKCLKKGRNGFIPIEVVRALRGCMNDDIKHGAVIATLPFGKAAHEEAKKYHVELIDVHKIIETMKRINPNFKGEMNQSVS